MIPKWYPYAEDVQFGVFIQKHAESIALENKVAVVFAHSVSALDTEYKFEIKRRDSLLEIIVSFRKDESAFANLINGYRYFSAVCKGIKKSKSLYSRPDLIHAYVLLRTAVVAYYFSLRYNIPYIVNEQWSGYATGKFNDESGFKKMLTRFLVRRSSGLISVSEFLLGKMHSCGIRNRNEKIIPNPVEAVESIFTKSESKVSVLLVADMVDEIKNISSVIRMAALVREKFRDFELRIIGHGKDREMLVELSRKLGVLNDVVFFEGLKSNPEVYQYLQRCDFLVMNSRFETFSLICCEALSCGKPVLATRCGGPQEFIDDETGILIPVDDETALEEKFLFMLNHYNRFNSQTIINKVQDRFSKKTISNRYSDFFDKVFSK